MSEEAASPTAREEAGGRRQEKSNGDTPCFLLLPPAD